MTTMEPQEQAAAGKPAADAVAPADVTDVTNEPAAAAAELAAEPVKDAAPAKAEESKTETETETEMKTEAKTETKTEEAAAAPSETAATTGDAPAAAAEGEAPKAAAEGEAAAATEAPATGTEAAAATAGPVWPQISDDHPISKLLKDLPQMLEEAQHKEVYGITLDAAGPFHTKLILQKFLRANSNNIEKAKDQLLETLKWRREFKALETLDETFDKERFDKLGYVLEVEGVPGSPNKKEVVTFNIYGAVKDNKQTFGDIEGFLRWRVGLMEKGIAKLNLVNATQSIPDFGKGPDPYQGIQVHDYVSVSFIRQDPYVKAASKRTIDLFQKVYPETLSRKFFVNVPVVMGWMFTAMKLVLSKETVRKFTVLSSGNQLASELGEGIPELYGGKAGALDAIGEQTALE